MLIIEKRVAEFLWGKAIVDAQETVLSPELIEEIEQDRALAIQSRLAREHGKRRQQTPLTNKEKRAAHDEIIKTIGQWEQLITHCERPSYGYQWSDYAQEGWDEFLFGCPWPAELRDRLAQMLLNYQIHSTVSPEWLARIEATDQRFRNLSMETPLSKEEMFELSPPQLPLDPDTQWYYYWQAKDYPDILKGVSWVEWFFNHHDPYEFPFLPPEQAHSINPRYVRLSWSAWKAGKYAEYLVDWDEVFRHHRKGHVAVSNHMPHNTWGEPDPTYGASPWAYLSTAWQIQCLGLSENWVPDFQSPFTKGAQVLHSQHGFGTVVDVNEERNRIDVALEKGVTTTYDLQWVREHQKLQVVVPKTQAPSSPPPTAAPPPSHPGS